MHAIGKHQSSFCVSVANLNSQPFSAFDNVRWSVSIAANKILYETHGNC